MQEEQNELNRVKDFDLDAWLDEVEPTHRVQTVNTKGSLLAKYARVQEQRQAVIAQMQHLADSLPDEPDEDDKTEALSGRSLRSSDAVERAEFDALREQLTALDEKANAIATEYSQNKVRVTFRNVDKSQRARITSSEQKKSKAQNGPDLTMIKLMHASIIQVDVITPSGEVKQDLGKWTAAFFGRFLDKIGDGQARLLADAYLGLASGEVTPPFSQES